MHELLPTLTPRTRPCCCASPGCFSRSHINFHSSRTASESYVPRTVFNSRMARLEVDRKCTNSFARPRPTDLPPTTCARGTHVAASRSTHPSACCCLHLHAQALPLWPWPLQPWPPSSTVPAGLPPPPLRLPPRLLALAPRFVAGVSVVLAPSWHRQGFEAGPVVPAPPARVGPDARKHGMCTDGRGAV